MEDDVAPATFVINNRDDITAYVIQSGEFDLVEAATMHLISLEIERRTEEIRQRKADRERKSVDQVNLTQDEIDQYIFNAFDTKRIDQFKEDATRFIEAYIQDANRSLTEEMLARHFATQRANIVVELEALRGRIKTDLRQIAGFNSESAREKITEHVIASLCAAVLFYFLFQVTSNWSSFARFVMEFTTHSH
jgi:hypothetical protein